MTDLGRMDRFWSLGRDSCKPTGIEPQPSVVPGSDQRKVLITAIRLHKWHGLEAGLQAVYHLTSRGNAHQKVFLRRRRRSGLPMGLVRGSYLPSANSYRFASQALNSSVNDVTSPKTFPVRRFRRLLTGRSIRTVSLFWSPSKAGPSPEGDTFLRTARQ